MKNCRSLDRAMDQQDINTTFNQGKKELQELLIRMIIPLNSLLDIIDKVISNPNLVAIEMEEILLQMQLEKTVHNQVFLICSSMTRALIEVKEGLT